MILLQPGTAMSVSIDHVADVLVVLAVAGKQLLDVRGGKKKDRTTNDWRRSLDDTIKTMGIDIRDLKAFVIGPDGENGIRGDMRKLTQRVDGLEERERDDLRAIEVGSLRPPRKR